MQAEFVTHFKTSHPGSKVKCEFCNSFFDSVNGLFKHERSHIYMKYACDACQKKFQFPYQLSAHNTQHTGVGKHQCSQCTKSFGSKCSKVFHAQTHGAQLKCDLCPMNSDKTFNNKPALLQHQRGVHGPGWMAVCRKNYKSKSGYTNHKKECKPCIQNKAQRNLTRFLFLRYVDLSTDASASV